MLVFVIIAVNHSISPLPSALLVWGENYKDTVPLPYIEKDKGKHVSIRHLVLENILYLEEISSSQW